MSVNLTINGIAVTGNDGETILKIAERNGINQTAKIPMDSKMAEACDSGKIENYENSYLSDFAKTLTEFLK